MRRCTSPHSTVGISHMLYVTVGHWHMRRIIITCSRLKLWDSTIFTHQSSSSAVTDETFIYDTMHWNVDSEREEHSLHPDGNILSQVSSFIGMLPTTGDPQLLSKDQCSHEAKQQLGFCFTSNIIRLGFFSMQSTLFYSMFRQRMFKFVYIKWFYSNTGKLWSLLNMFINAPPKIPTGFWRAEICSFECPASSPVDRVSVMCVNHEGGSHARRHVPAVFGGLPFSFKQKRKNQKQTFYFCVKVSNIYWMYQKLKLYNTEPSSDIGDREQAHKVTNV